MAARQLATQRIHRMSTELASLVAAGEVIARPASVVKELVENSLDSGATTIDIHLSQGGVRAIEVRDNGKGIHRDDLNLAITQHASSKLINADQLNTIDSLGFRGEALASMVVVSRFELTSRTQDADSAYTLNSYYKSEETSIIPAAHPLGTTIKVQDLFYNRPARRKFLRAPRTEFSYVEEVVRRLALSAFDVQWSFSHNGKKLWSLAKASTQSDRTARVGQLLNRDFIKNARVIDIERPGLRLSGWVGSPQFHRSQKDWQVCYLNGRVVRDKVINHAIRCEYDAYIPAGRYYACVLSLECDATEVDVNVHPTKHEVQFRNPRWIHDFVRQSVRQALQSSSVSEDESKSQPQINQSEQCSAELNVQEKKSSTPLFKVQSRVAECKQETQAAARFPLNRSKTQAEEVALKDSLHALYGINKKPLKKTLRLLATLEQHTVLMNYQEHLFVVDSLRAQQAIVLERLLQSLQQAKPPNMKPLLFPTTVTIQAKQLEWIEEKEPLLRALGFELSALSSDTLSLRQTPEFLTLDLGAWSSAVLANLEAYKTKEAWATVLAQHSTMPCYAALTHQTLQTLWDDLTGLETEVAQQWRATAWTSWRFDYLKKRIQHPSPWLELTAYETD